MWQPIETAPKDGTVVMVFAWYHGQPFYQLAAWVSSANFDGPTDGIWVCSNRDFVNDCTHWMPLPEPPKEGL